MPRHTEWFRVDYGHFKKYLKSQGLSLRELGRESGVSEKTVLRMKDGEVSKRTAEKILHYVRLKSWCSHRELFGYSENYLDPITVRPDLASALMAYCEYTRCERCPYNAGEFEGNSSKCIFYPEPSKLLW